MSGPHKPGNEVQLLAPQPVADAVAALLARAAGEPVEVAEWWADLEHIWRERRRREVERWAARAVAMRALRDSLDDDVSKADAHRRAEYADARARSQAMSRRHRLAVCRRRWITFGCACQRIERPVGCDATLLCDWCRRRHLRRWRRRITKSLAAYHRAEHAAWRAAKRPAGREPHVYLVTLTVGHSGDVERDRRDLWRGWRAWQKWLAVEVGGTFPYAAVWEVTAGRDGLGHVHCHVAAVLPYFDFGSAHAAWRTACPRSSNADYQRVTANGHGRPAQRAAKYLSKYVTKGTEVGDMPGALAGAVLASWYGKRKVSTSRHFWRVQAARGKACCRRCEHQWSVLERPRSLARTSVEAVWFALAEVHRVALPRGPAQVRLRFELPVDVGASQRRGLHSERS